MRRAAGRSRKASDGATLPLFAAAESSAPEHAAAPLRTVQLDPREGPQAWLADAFAERVAAWVDRAGGAAASIALLRNAAHAVSVATASGHACIHIRDLPEATGNVDAVRNALLASKVVATADAPGGAPLVLDAEGRLYLHRYFAYEQRIAQRLARSQPRVLDAASEKQLAMRLTQLFAGNAELVGNDLDWQKIAAALAVINGFTVISGGPGTGKTTTVVNLLACLIDLEPDCRIALAAPTGKAAARMQDALRERCAHLPCHVQERLPRESFTIHRLLGVSATGTGFVHHAGNPLAYDVVVIDEASMLDLALAAKLFDAVPESARIILLGDKDQLAAVESGAVFSELSADPALSAECIARLTRLCQVTAASIVAPSSKAPTPLHDRVVWFTRNYRFGAQSRIGRLAQAINDGDTSACVDELKRDADASITWRDDAGKNLSPESLAILRDGYAPYIDALRTQLADKHAIFDAFECFRVLCAERASPRGVGVLNDVVGSDCRDALEAQWPSPGRSVWYAGRPIMVLRNDYVMKLYNGDIGIALPDEHGTLSVHFRQADGEFRVIAPMRLPEHETAFATTVHKAQGSEFDAVALVLPFKVSGLLTRELLYTAVTRARARLTLITGADVLSTAIATPTLRHSGLIARLREARGGAG